MGFDPYAETPRGGGGPQSPQGSLPAVSPNQDETLRLEPPEPPQLVLPSLARRLSSIVKLEVGHPTPAVMQHTSCYGSRLTSAL